jgi:hypothetical protein
VVAPSCLKNLLDHLALGLSPIKNKNGIPAKKNYNHPKKSQKELHLCLHSTIVQKKKNKEVSRNQDPDNQVQLDPFSQAQNKNIASLPTVSPLSKLLII